jgi:hypothetical protein
LAVWSFALTLGLTALAAAGPADDLIAAARRGDAATVQALLDKGVDVNAKDSNGCTALMQAAAGGRLTVVRLLIDKQADVNAQTTCGNALFFASQNGLLAIVQALLASGADVSYTNEFGMTALTRASDGGYRDVVQALLAKGAQFPDKPSVEKAATYDTLLESYLLNAEKSLKDKGYYSGDIEHVNSDDLAAAFETFQNGNNISETIRLPHPATDKALGITFNPTNSCYWTNSPSGSSLQCPPELGCKASMVMASQAGGFPTVSGYQVSCPGKKDRIISLPPSGGK